MDDQPLKMIRPAVLEWAVGRSGRPRSELLGACPALDDWTRTTRRVPPTLAGLETFAHETRTPHGYLFLSEPPDEPDPIPWRRTDPRAPSTPKATLLHLVYRLQRRQDWMHDDRSRDLDDSTPWQPEREEPRDAAALLARARNALNLHGAWTRTMATPDAVLDLLRERAEASGVLVFGNDNEPGPERDEVAGIALPDDVAPLVYVHDAAPVRDQIVSLAHGLMHLCADAPAAYDLTRATAADDETERTCAQAAGALLLPQRKSALAKDATDGGNGEDALERLARRTHASPWLILEHARSRDWIDDDEHARRATALERETPERPATTHTPALSRAFMNALAREIGSEQTSYTEAYRLSGLHGADFDEYVRRHALT